MKIKKIIDKTKTIIEAWSNVIVKDEEFESLFQQRLATCENCEFKTKPLGIDTCGICGCPILGKTHSKRVDDDGFLEDCPKGFWKPYLREDNEGKYILKHELPKNLQQYFKNEVISYEVWIEFMKEK